MISYAAMLMPDGHASALHTLVLRMPRYLPFSPLHIGYAGVSITPRRHTTVTPFRYAFAA